MQQVVTLLRSHIQRGFLLILLFDITHIKTHSTYKANKLTHPYKYILIPTAMCSQLVEAAYLLI